MFPLFKLGLGDRLGPGDQYWSWISLRDEVRALQFLLEQEQLSGPVKPHGAGAGNQQRGDQGHGPGVGPAHVASGPSLALKAVLGEFSTEVLGSARVLPNRLTSSGFVFQDATSRLGDPIRPGRRLKP